MTPRRRNNSTFFFAAVGDKFSRIAFVGFKIAEHEIQPHIGKQNAHCDRGGVSVVRKFGPHLVADSCCLTEEAAKRCCLNLEAKSGEAGINSEPNAERFVAIRIAESLSLL